MKLLCAGDKRRWIVRESHQRTLCDLNVPRLWKVAREWLSQIHHFRPWIERSHYPLNFRLWRWCFLWPHRQRHGPHLTDMYHPPCVFGGVVQLTWVMGLVFTFARAGLLSRELWI